MPRTDDGIDESFRGLVLQLRGRIGLTQRELAGQMGVHVHSIQGWESGAKSPGAASLKGLIAAGFLAGGFSAEHEAEEAEALWSSAMRDAPRLRTPFDPVWFDGIAAQDPRPTQRDDQISVVEAPAPRPVNEGVRRHSWGEAPDVVDFLGRATERELLTHWVRDERCRVVALLGLGGIGKSLLATRLAHDVAPSFEYVVWRTLRDAPTPSEWLTGVIGFLAPNDAPGSGGEPALLRRLLELLRESRCLLVLDNVETVFQSGGRVGGYRADYERYGTVLRQLGEAPHQSCLVVTSREEPAELGPLQSDRGPIRILNVGGFDVEDGRALLSDKRLDGDEATWQTLVGRCGGNGLALKVVGETIRELFDRSIANYLKYTATSPGTMAGGIGDLLEAQIQRLSVVEQDLLRWLAIEREPVSLAQIDSDLGPQMRRGATLESVGGLRRRSLLERREGRQTFTLQSVVLEYITERLVEEVVQELEAGEPDHLLRLPLMKATSKDYVRRGQERLIAGPLVKQLIATHGSARVAESWLMRMLDGLRGRTVDDQGYGPGNLVNLLRLLHGDLKGVDLSGLTIRQAYLQEVEAQGASLAGAHLSETVLGEAFRFPTAVALTADGAYLVAGTASGEVCRWRVADRTLLTTLHGHAGGVHGVALSRDGLMVASGGDDGTLRLWEAGTGLLLAAIQGHTGGVHGVALSRDGLLASGGDDGAVRLWEAESGLLLATLYGHTGVVWGVALSEDGRLVASGSLDGTVRVWEAGNGQPLAVLHGHTGGVHSVALSGDGRLLASGSLDGTVRLWEAATGRPLATLQGHTGGVLGVALSGDGKLAVSGGFDGTMRLWEAGTGRPLATLHGHTGGVLGVALSGDGRLVASGGFDGTMRLWEAEDGRPLTMLQGQSGGVHGVALSRDGRLVASGGFDKTARLWETETGRPLGILQGHAGGVHGVALSGDGRLVASGGDDGTVRLWEAESGRPLAALQGHTGGVLGVALSEDGRLVASGGFDGTVRIWEAGTGRLLATLQGHTGLVLDVALSGDGRLVASGGLDGTVRLWEAGTGRPLAILQGHTGGVHSLAMSGDGRLVASGGDDGTVRLWEAESGLLLATLHGHTEGVWGVALSGDGRRVASGSLDGTVRVWDASSGALRRMLRAERRYEALDITGLTGITDAQRETLLTLGAVERKDHSAAAT